MNNEQLCNLMPIRTHTTKVTFYDTQSTSTIGLVPISDYATLYAKHTYIYAVILIMRMVDGWAVSQIAVFTYKSSQATD